MEKIIFSPPLNVKNGVERHTDNKRSNQCPLKVFARVRPFIQREVEVTKKRPPIVEVDVEQPNAIITSFPTSNTETKREVFTFERCFSGVTNTNSMTLNDGEVSAASDQLSVYMQVGLPILHSVLDGYNGCILAYGQTGSGKTFTMMGPPSVLCSGGTVSHCGGKDIEVMESKRTMEGIIPRLVRDLFEALQRKHLDDETHSFKLELEYYEVYKEKVMDLLSTTSEDPLRVRNDIERGPFVEGLTRKQITSVSEIFKWIKRGNMERHIGVTRMNDRSSRSHAVLTLHLTQMQLRGPNGIGVNGKDELTAACVKSKLNLVDLAGSERAAASGAEGLQLQEANKINSSLTVLGRVIDALAEASQGKRKNSAVFCPYRDSTLTWLLMDSIGGNSKTSMIATVSPHFMNYEETSQTLRYASRAKQIISTVCVNEDPQLVKIRMLTAEIKRLRERIGNGEEDGSRDEEMETLRERVQFLEDQLVTRDELISQLRADLNPALRTDYCQEVRQLSTCETHEVVEFNVNRSTSPSVTAPCQHPCNNTHVWNALVPNYVQANVQDLEKVLKQKESVISALRAELDVSKRNEKERCRELQQSRKIKQSQIDRAVNEERQKWQEVVFSLKKSVKRIRTRDATPHEEGHSSHRREKERKQSSRRASSASLPYHSLSHREAYFRRRNSSHTSVDDSSLLKNVPPTYPRVPSSCISSNKEMHSSRRRDRSSRTLEKSYCQTDYVSPAFERYDSFQSARSRRSSRGHQSEEIKPRTTPKTNATKKAKTPSSQKLRKSSSEKKRSSRISSSRRYSSTSVKGSQDSRSSHRGRIHSPKGGVPSLADLYEDFELCRTMADAERREHLKIVSNLQQENESLSKQLTEEQERNAEVKAKLHLLPPAFSATVPAATVCEEEEETLVVIPPSRLVEYEKETNKLRGENRQLQEALSHHQTQVSVLRRILAARDRIYEEVNKMGINPACFVEALTRIEAASRSEWEEEERLNRAFILQQLQLHNYYMPLLHKLKRENALMSQANILEIARTRQFSKDLHVAQTEHEELIKANEAALKKIHYLKHQLQKETSRVLEVQESMMALRHALQQAREECACNANRREPVVCGETEQLRLLEEVSSLQHTLELKNEEVETLKQKLKKRHIADDEKIGALECQLHEVHSAFAAKESCLQAEIDYWRRESNIRTAYMTEEQERNDALRKELSGVTEALEVEKSERERIRMEFHNYSVTNTHKMIMLKKELEAFQRQSISREAELREELNTAIIEKEKYSAVYQDQYSFLQRKVEQLEEELHVKRNECGELLASQKRVQQDLEKEMQERREEHGALLEANEAVLKKVRYLKRIVQQEEEKSKRAEELVSALKDELKRAESSPHADADYKKDDAATFNTTIQEMQNVIEEKAAKISQLEQQRRELKERITRYRRTSYHALEAARLEWCFKQERYEAEIRDWRDKCNNKDTTKGTGAMRTEAEQPEEIVSLFRHDTSLVAPANSTPSISTEFCKMDGKINEGEAKGNEKAAAIIPTFDSHERNELLEAQNRTLMKANSNLQNKIAQLQDELSVKEIEIQELQELKNMNAHLDRLEEEQQSVTSAGSTGRVSAGVKQSWNRFSTLIKNKLLRRGSGGPPNACSDGDGQLFDMNNSFASSIDTFTSAVDVPSLHQMLSAKIDCNPHGGFRKRGPTGVGTTPQPTPRCLSIDADDDEWYLGQSVDSRRPSSHFNQGNAFFHSSFTQEDGMTNPKEDGQLPPLSSAFSPRRVIHNAEEAPVKTALTPLLGLRPRPQNQMDDESARKKDHPWLTANGEAEVPSITLSIE